MSFLSEITNPFINVRNKIRSSTGWEDLKKKEESSYQKNGLRVSLNHKVFEVWGKKVIIDSLHYASTKNAYPKLLITKSESNNWDNELLHVPYNSVGTTGRTYPTGSGIEKNSSNYLDFIYTANDVSVITLKRPIVLANGGQLIFTGGSDDNVTYNILYRVVDE